MRCHYEVLEVSRDADDNQIKTAYKKLALRWHPDKNLSEPQEAKEQFQLIQQAYEILSDRQERAWYDNHREQILYGGNKYEDNNLDVFPFFTSSCFKGHNDGPNGFYTVYRKVFEDIAHEDIEYMDDKDEYCMIPSFGTSASDYDEVVGPFYAYWMSYSTKKSYAWLAPYNINEVRERRILRLMEKENKKIRQKARKERNEEIRNLVAFVRKRDKRVQEYLKRLEAKILHNRQKQEEISRQKWLERKKLNESNGQAEWTKFDNVQSELEEIEKSLAQQFGEQLSDLSNDTNSETELDNLYCVACNKVFKTPKAFENHEMSKKHRENVEKLKDTINDDDQLIEEEFEMENISDNANGDELDVENIPGSDIEANLSSSDNGPESLNGFLDVAPKRKMKKSRNVIRTTAATMVSDEESISNIATDGSSKNANVADSDNDFSSGSKKSRRRSRRNKGEMMPLSRSEPELGAMDTPQVDNAQALPVEEKAMDECAKKNGKKSKKGQKKTLAESPSDALDVEHCCVTCKATFSSKNKLFEHIKKENHGVYIPKNERKPPKSNPSRKSTDN